MAWADVPAKLAQWQAETYYMTNGVARLNAEFGVSSYENVPVSRRTEYEELLDYYLDVRRFIHAPR